MRLLENVVNLSFKKKKKGGQFVDYKYLFWRTWPVLRVPGVGGAGYWRASPACNYVTTSGNYVTTSHFLSYTSGGPPSALSQSGHPALPSAT